MLEYLVQNYECLCERCQPDNAMFILFILRLYYLYIHTQIPTSRCYGEETKELIKAATITSKFSFKK